MNEPLTLDRFISAPRLSGLRLSPDGRRLVVAVSRPGPEANEYKTALWQVDPTGAAAPRRLTRSAAGETAATFARDGSILFTSTRPDPDAKADPEHKIAALWHLPMEGGEARLLLAPEGGIEGAAAARDADAVALGISVHSKAKDLEDDAARAKARKDAKVGALLFDDYPIRYWDHWLAPQRQRMFAARLPEDPEAKLEPVDLTGDPGPAFLEPDFDISPDGKTVVTSWFDWTDLPKGPEDLYAVDVESKKRRKLTGGDGYYGGPKFSPDGKWVACSFATFGQPGKAAARAIWLIDVATGKGRSITPTLDLWPESPVWAEDSGAVFFVGERLGHVAAFRVDLAGGEITCLVPEGSVSDLCPDPDGATIYALYATMSHPPRIVRFAARGENQTPVELRRSIDDGGLAGRGRVERLSAKAADGQAVGSWLVLPPDATPEKPAPVVVFAHGGPIGSWSGWHWRWNAHLLAERGYAVLLPDPAISIGYGQHMIQRGWGLWGEAPYTDILSALDGALARKDLDSTRVALAGGSFGGYMANWVAGHTDRFRAIVSHASIWEVRPFHGTTDMGSDWEHEMGDPYRHPELYDRQSPAPHVGSIRTPMLVIHGEHDFRVPLSEALMLWTDLRRFGVPARFLYVPDENHWVLKPANARLWYETVMAFLDEHVLGKEWVRPELL
jgi:dipeptidyl aminopeptidase/acylaminoacyl peptidase